MSERFFAPCPRGLEAHLVAELAELGILGATTPAGWDGAELDPVTYALLLAFFRNDMGFGGNNGLTDFKDIFGANIQSDATRAAPSAPIIATVAKPATPAANDPLWQRLRRWRAVSALAIEASVLLRLPLRLMNDALRQDHVRPSRRRDK